MLHTLFDDFNENIQKRLALLMISAYESKLNQGFLRTINFVKEDKREFIEYLIGGANLSVAQFILMHPHKYSFLAPITTYNNQNNNLVLTLPFLILGSFYFFKATKSIIEKLDKSTLKIRLFLLIKTIIGKLCLKCNKAYNRI